MSISILALLCITHLFGPRKCGAKSLRWFFPVCYLFTPVLVRHLVSWTWRTNCQTFFSVYKTDSWREKMWPLVSRPRKIAGLTGFLSKWSSVIFQSSRSQTYCNTPGKKKPLWNRSTGWCQVWRDSCCYVSPVRMWLWLTTIDAMKIYSCMGMLCPRRHLVRPDIALSGRPKMKVRNEEEELCCRFTISVLADKLMLMYGKLQQKAGLSPDSHYLYFHASRTFQWGSGTTYYNS